VPHLRRRPTAATTALNDCVLISRWALADIYELAHESADGKETGGILVGFDATAEQPLTVTVAGDAGPGAERSPTGFRRDVRHAQQLADLAWATDGSYWVGDWHTHPSGRPVPSHTDLGGYRRVLAAGDMPAFLSIIVCPTDDGAWEQPWLQAWLVSASQCQAVELVAAGREASVAVAAR
jgi:integrative and conjugative element protein (TIGR02256 family)